LTLEEQEMLEELEPFTLEEIVQLHMARQEVGHRRLEGTTSSENDLTMGWAETSSGKPPFATSFTQKESARKKSSKKSTEHAAHNIPSFRPTRCWPLCPLCH
jgi:hypothetical protein